MAAYDLDVVDRFDEIIANGDETYLYRINTGGTRLERALRTAKGSWATIVTYTGIASGTTAIRDWLITSDGAWYVTCLVSGTWTVYRSQNQGSSWSSMGTLNYPLLPGNNFGWAEHTDGYVYIGEYDQLGSSSARLMRVALTGSALEVVNTWTNANVKHIHHVNSFGGYLWIGVGDSDDESGIIRVDTSLIDWADVGDTAPKDLTGITGLVAIGGLQRYRCTSLASWRGDVYSFADAAVTAKAGGRGIFRFTPDLDSKTWRNINDDQIQYDDYSGYLSLATQRQALFVNYVSGGSGTQTEISVWGTRDGETAKRIMEVRGENIDTAPRNTPSGSNVQVNVNTFWYDALEDTIYLGLTPAAGWGGSPLLTQKQTVAIKVLDRDFAGPLPHVGLPITFVDGENGDDLNDGTDARNPFASIGRALSVTQPQNVMRSGCVRVAAGTYSEAGFTFGSFNTTTHDANVSYVELRGEGREGANETHLRFSSGTNGILREGADQQLLISDMKISHTGATAGGIIRGNATGYGQLTLQDCIIGQSGDNHDKAIWAQNDLIKIYRSFLLGPAAASKEVLFAAEASPTDECKIQAYASIIVGGNVGCWKFSAGEIELYQCAVMNYRTTGYIDGSASTNRPLVRATVFFNNDGGVNPTPFDDDSGSSYTTELQFVIGDVSSNADGVADDQLADGSIIDPDCGQAGGYYVDPQNYDFTPTSHSNARNQLDETWTSHGYDRVAFTNKPPIGPFGDLATTGGGGSTRIIGGSIIGG